MEPTTPTEAEIREWCVAYLAKTLDLPPADIGPDVPFARLGLDSGSSAHFVVELEDWLGLELTPDLVGDYPTIAELAHYLVSPAARGG